MNKAYILAGGFGTRLFSAIQDLPKSLAPVAGKPFILYPLRWLRNQGITDITLCVGYKANDIARVLGDGEQLGMNLSYSLEEQPLGTGGALQQAMKNGPLPAVILNGDTFVDCDLNPLIEYHNESGAWVTLLLRRELSGKARGCVELTPGGLIRSFMEKPAINTSDVLISAGVYIFGVEFNDEIFPAYKSSLERDLFPNLARLGLLAGYVSAGYFADIGTPESLLQFEMDVIEGKINDYP